MFYYLPLRKIFSTTILGTDTNEVGGIPYSHLHGKVPKFHVSVMLGILMSHLTPFI